VTTQGNGNSCDALLLDQAGEKHTDRFKNCCKLKI
jgi:hypothetical protein